MRTHGTHHVMCYGSGQAQSLFSPEHIEFLVTLFLTHTSVLWESNKGTDTTLCDKAAERKGVEKKVPYLRTHDLH
jgi:hypothetical protein